MAADGAGGGPDRGSRRVRIGAAAALLAGSVLVSRLIGYVRVVVLADRLGAGPEADAYFAAFFLPDVLNYLLAGGALGIAFIPLYGRVREGEGRAAAERLAAVVLGGVALVAVVLTVAGWLAADVLVDRAFSGFDAETRALTARLTRILLPAQIFFLTGGILRAVLMAEGRFASQALAPLLYNGAIIVGGWWTGTAQGFVWGALVGAVIGPWLVPLLDLRRTHRVGIQLALGDRHLRTYLWTALPLMLGLSLLTVDEWFDKVIGSRLEMGSVAWLSYARQLMQAPIAVVGQAVAAAALPALSELYHRGEHAQLDRTLLRTLQAAGALALLSGAACWAFAEPLVDLVYRRGDFGPEDARRVTELLVIFSFAVPGWVLQQVAVRAFYARGDTWRPMWLGTLVAVLALPLYVALGDALAARGLALAGALAMSANALATLVWARRRHGAPDLAALAGTLARTGLVAGAAALVLVPLRPWWPGEGRIGALAELALGGSVFGLLVWVGVRTIGDAVAREAVSRLSAGLRRRLARRRE